MFLIKSRDFTAIKLNCTFAAIFRKRWQAIQAIGSGVRQLLWKNEKEKKKIRCILRKVAFLKSPLSDTYLKSFLMSAHGIYRYTYFYNKK